LRAVRLMPRSRSLTDRGLSPACSASSSCVSRASVRSCLSKSANLSPGSTSAEPTPARPLAPRQSSPEDDGHHDARYPAGKQAWPPAQTEHASKPSGIPGIRDDTTHPAQPSTPTGTAGRPMPHFAADTQTRIWPRGSSSELADLRLVTDARSTAERGAESAVWSFCAACRGMPSVRRRHSVTCTGGLRWVSVEPLGPGLAQPPASARPGGAR